jgi:hypothetical protein
MVCLHVQQDMVSYNIEQAIGDVRWNILAIIMRQFGTDINGAMARAHDYHREKQRRFISLINQVPSFGPEVDSEVAEYIFVLANWVQANNNWNFEGGRYLGPLGFEVRRTRKVELFPKINAYTDLFGNY